jgi:radical SAM protein with 4Fe4S-binding SPASM domain
VSDLTARECKQLLDKPVDIVTPNGFEQGFVPQGEDFDAARKRARNALISLARAKGIDAKATDMLIGTAGRYEWKNKGIDVFLEAMRKLGEANLPSTGAADLQRSALIWDVVTCVNQRTINQLDEMREYLWSIGVRNWRLITIDPMGRAAENPELLLTPQQHRYLLDYIRDRRKEGLHISYSCEGFMPDYEVEIRDSLFHCAAGVSVASILIDGSISACTSIRGKYYQGNIYKDDFWDVWENRFESYRNRDWMRQLEPCNTCKLFRYCEGGGMHLRREDGSLMLCHHSKIDN